MTRQDDEPRTPPAPPAADGQRLADLMKGGGAPDLEAKALAAAEAAIAAGEQALRRADDALRPQTAARPGPARPGVRELVLRTLLAVNLAAMVVVVLLPQRQRTAVEQVLEQPDEAAPDPAPAVDPAPRLPSLDDPVVRAFAAADQRDYATAIRLLQDHLRDTPRMAPARRANVLLALEHYASQVGDFAAAADYQRRAEALRHSHSLPEDLVQMALEAEKRGDAESMRRHYARLLLQQRQIPSALYRHVAEAYLKLGDSYRKEADQAAAAARRAELQRLREDLRRQALGDPSGQGDPPGQDPPGRGR